MLFSCTYRDRAGRERGGDKEKGREREKDPKPKKYKIGNCNIQARPNISARQRMSKMRQKV